MPPTRNRATPAWALTFGNHDEDSVKKTSMTETRIMDFLRRYPHNLNLREDALNGHSNLLVEVAGSRSRRTAAALWLLDSGRYEQDSIDGQEVEEYAYETIHSDQVAWYREQSIAVQKRAGRPVPVLMWTHIPLWQARFMWFGSPTDWTEQSHAKALAKHQITDPQRNEREYLSQFNSGLHKVVRERGDVMGIYFGHDHRPTPRWGGPSASKMPRAASWSRAGSGQGGQQLVAAGGGEHPVADGDGGDQLVAVLQAADGGRGILVLPDVAVRDALVGRVEARHQVLAVGAAGAPVDGGSGGVHAPILGRGRRRPHRPGPGPAIPRAAALLLLPVCLHALRPRHRCPRLG